MNLDEKPVQPFHVDGEKRTLYCLCLHPFVKELRSSSIESVFSSVTKRSLLALLPVALSVVSSFIFS